MISRIAIVPGPPEENAGTTVKWLRPHPATRKDRAAMREGWAALCRKYVRMCHFKSISDNEATSGWRQMHQDGCRRLIQLSGDGVATCQIAASHLHRGRDRRHAPHREEGGEAAVAATGDGGGEDAAGGDGEHGAARKMRGGAGRRAQIAKVEVLTCQGVSILSFWRERLNTHARHSTRRHLSGLSLRHHEMSHLHIVS